MNRFKARKLTDVPRGLSFKKSALCTQSAFMWQGGVVWDVILCRVMEIYQVTLKWRHEIPPKSP